MLIVKPPYDGPPVVQDGGNRVLTRVALDALPRRVDVLRATSDVVLMCEPQGDPVVDSTDATFTGAGARPIYERAAAGLAMALLSAHVPLTLLWDLSERSGPHSADILSHELIARIPAARSGTSGLGLLRA